LAPPYYSQRAVFASLWALFHIDNEMSEYSTVRMWYIRYYSQRRSEAKLSTQCRFLRSVHVTQNRIWADRQILRCSNLISAQ